MADDKYSFDVEKLRKENGGKLPSEREYELYGKPAGFPAKYNGKDENHDKEKVIHRLLVDEKGNIIAETVFVPEFNAAGKEKGFEPSLVAAVNDPRFNVTLKDGKPEISGPAKLTVIDARDTNLDIDRKANTVKTKDGKAFKAVEIIPNAEKQPTGKEYNYHAYFYLPKGKAPDKDGVHVSRVTLEQTGDAPKDKKGIVGEVFISQGSAHLVMNSAQPLIYAFKFIENEDCHHRVTFAGASGATDKVKIRPVGERTQFVDPQSGVELHVDGVPETLDVNFARANKKGEYEFSKPISVVKEGKREEVNQDLADAIEGGRVLFHFKEPDKKEKKESPDKKESPQAEFDLPGLRDAVALFNAGITNPQPIPAQKGAGDPYKGK